LKTVLDLVDSRSQPTPKKSFLGNDTDQDLRFLCGDEVLPPAVLDASFAKKAAACLVTERKLLNGDYERGTFLLEFQRLGQYAKLDAAAIEALNLFPTRDGGTTVNGSVHTTLNHCVTKQMGSRLLRRWIRQPLMDVHSIKYRQDIVASLKEDTMRRTSIQGTLKGIPDLSILCRRLESGKAGLKQLYELYMFVQKLPMLAANMCEIEHGESPPSDDLKALGNQLRELSSSESLGKFSSLIEEVLDFDLAPREFRIQHKHDKTGEMTKLAEELSEIQTERDEERDSLLENELSGMGAKFENDFGSIKTYGFHFRIHKSFDNELKKLKGSSYQYLCVVSAGIRWTTTSLKSLHENYVKLTTKLNSAQRGLIKEAVTVAATFVPLFEKSAEIVSPLDVLCSFAHVAAYAPSDYCCPRLIPIGDDNRVMRLTQARHPCLEIQDGMEFIANDYELDPLKSKFQIITGPNMGGKSTYIRQLGTIVVMAQIGSFVPCDSADIPVVDAVLARVGASDAQLRGISTFMAEMVEASAIVKTATSDSLVIIDELGRGTSTYDGFGLAWAISEYLACKIKPFCLFATHFHELTALVHKIPVVKNRHVTALATDESIIMLYTVNDGPCGESFGINIARMAGFPNDVLECAKRKAVELETFTLKADSDKDESKRLRVENAKMLVKKFAALEKSQLTNPAVLKALLTF